MTDEETWLNGDLMGMLYTKNKIIAKNTILLYIRVLLIMVVSLYTSRIILEVLGIEDYGIYNLVAGFVTFFAFIRTALVTSMQRYFNVALGQNDIRKYKQAFSMSINILFIFCLLVFLIGESVGLWFVNSHIDIPTDRVEAALWVYHISLLTFVINAMRTPYHASIIAYEKMTFYAYISILEVFLKLGMVFSLIKVSYDSLVMYAFLYGVLTIMINVAYVVFCRLKLDGCKYAFQRDVKLFKELMCFSGWTILAQSSIIVKNQGEAILLNRFFSVLLNAAMGVALQVINAIEMFVLNFQTAFNPQLTQTYASGNIEDHYLLLCRSSKFSFFLLLIFLLPVSFNIDMILEIWLKEVPQYTNVLVRFILISYLFNALSTPFATSILAKGDIKNYQISVFLIFLGGLLLVYYLFMAGKGPYYIAYVAVVIQVLLLASRVCYTHLNVGFGYGLFLKSVLLPCLKVTILSLITPVLCEFINDGSLLMSLFIIILEILVTISIILYLGMDNRERSFICGLFRKFYVRS